MHPVFPQVHDAHQWKKWGVHDRQRQRRLPHIKSRVSFPERSTCPPIKYSVGWGKLCFSRYLLWNGSVLSSVPSNSKFTVILLLLCSLFTKLEKANWHQLSNLVWKVSTFQFETADSNRTHPGESTNEMFQFSVFVPRCVFVVALCCVLSRGRWLILPL